MNIFEPDDPRVLDGIYDVDGYTPKERRALERKRASSEKAKTSNSTADRFGIWRCDTCGRVEPCELRHAAR